MYILKLPKLVPVVEMCCPFYLFYMFSRLNGLLRAIAICKIALFPFFLCHYHRLLSLFETFFGKQEMRLRFHVYCSLPMYTFTPVQKLKCVIGMCYK